MPDSPPPFSRLLIIRLSALGDVICVLPALDAIRASFPEAFIGFAVEDRAYALIKGHPCVDRVHLFSRRRWVDSLAKPGLWPRVFSECSDFVRGMRAERYDLALELQGNLKGAAHGLLCGARLRVGFSAENCREGSHIFTHLHVPPVSKGTHLADKYLAAAAFVGASPEKAAFRLPESPESAKRASEFLASSGLEEFVLIHPGTSAFGRKKRWLPERFSQLARRIFESFGLRSLVTWGPGEEDLARAVASRTNGAAREAFQTSLLDLAELLRRCRLFVGSDTGPLHLASAVRAPSVALFGPMDPAVYGPYKNPRSRVLRKPESGDPAAPASMDAITVDDAYGACAELLSSNF